MSQSEATNLTNIGLAIATMDDLIQAFEKIGLTEEIGIIDAAMKQLFQAAQRRRLDDVKRQLAAEGVVLDAEEEEFLQNFSKMTDRQRAKVLADVKAAAEKATH